MAHEILDRPIAFQRAFAELTGSITAGLMLSQAVYWQRQRNKDLEPGDDGWWWKTREQWTEETFMTRKEQESARKRLAMFDWWQEDRRGVPAKMFYHVDLDALLEAVLRLDGPKGANCKARKVPTGRTESGHHLKVDETTTETTAERKEKRSPQTPHNSKPDIPDWLNPQAWQDWLDHRKETKNPVTDLAARKAINELSRLKAQGHDPVTVIEHSILNGWRGLFPPKPEIHPARKQRDPFAPPPDYDYSAKGTWFDPENHR